MANKTGKGGFQKGQAASQRGCGSSGTCTTNTAVEPLVLVEVAGNHKAPPAARIAACNAILDRGYGKPAQMVHTEIEEKRSLLDWTTEELLAMIDKPKEASDQDCSEPDEDCGNPAKSDEVIH